MAGLTESYCRSNETSHASQFKWLDNTFKETTAEQFPVLIIILVHSAYIAISQRSHRSQLQYLYACIILWSAEIAFLKGYLEPVFLNFYGAQELIPRNEFRQPM